MQVGSLFAGNAGGDCEVSQRLAASLVSTFNSTFSVGPLLATGWGSEPFIIFRAHTLAPATYKVRPSYTYYFRNIE